MSEGSISQWLNQLKAGDPSVAQPLWDRYFERLVELARKKLQGSRQAVADEEDVALSVFASFCRGAAHGRFPRVNDRTDLWRLLIVLTARKAFRLRRDQQRKKRGGPGPGAFGPTSSRCVETASDLHEVVGREPTPEFAAQVAEEFQRLLGRLGNGELRSIALWKMEGYNNEEIAGQLSCARTTVERRLRLIRTLWKQEIAP
jgi:DNA-directed RNA polymerase specialized sigma24 family protein